MRNLPKTMLAVSISEPGPPDVLQSVSVPIPEPGTNDVLVRVAAAGIDPLF